jgi:hypothetical protein
MRLLDKGRPMKRIILYFRSLAEHIWHLIEPVLEHGCLAIMFAGLLRAVSIVLTWFLPEEEWRDIHEIEALGQSLVALLFVIHTLGILAIRIVQSFAIEMKRGAQFTGNPYDQPPDVDQDGEADREPRTDPQLLITEGSPRIQPIADQRSRITREGRDEDR